MAFSKRSKVSLISSVMVGRNSSLRTMCSANGGFALATSSPLGSVPKYATLGKLSPKVVLPVPGPPLTRILKLLGNSAMSIRLDEQLSTLGNQLIHYVTTGSDLT